MKTFPEIIPVASADEGNWPRQDLRLQRECLIRVGATEEARPARPASARLPGARAGTSRDARRPGRMNIDEERRQALRYPLGLPVEIGSARGRTRDFSASGVFFETDRALAPGDAVRFSVMLGRVSPRVPLRLRCEGRVVRIEPRTGRLGVGVAITRCH
jgi:hypothetical protein